MIAHTATSPSSQPTSGVRRLLVLILVGAFAFVPTSPISAAHAARRPSQETAPIRVRLSQLNWQGANGVDGIPRSRVGVAEFVFGPQSTQLLQENGGGYVNLVTQRTRTAQPQWSVRNLYLSYRDTEAMLGSTPSVMFDLGVQNGRRLSESFFDVFVTVEPLYQPPGLLRPKKAKILLEDFHVGGRNDGGSELWSLPHIVGPWICPPVLPVRVASITIDVDDIVEVDEPDMACAPGAVTRSIKYMMGACGVATEGVDDMNGHLDDAMGTDASGTTDDNMLAGKNQYVEDNGLPIDSELQYWDEIPEGIEGATDLNGDVSGVLDALNDGADIEILITWSAGGGHVAMVTSIVQLADGSYLITYVDDPDQGDGNAENEEHVIHVGPDGSFAGGQVDGFLVEHPTCG
jgi:hypothetical protein